jgi:2-polyprenyl-6-methoxyphenol hydroxylase-like FAD-dependent oxidoreductase
MLWCGHADQKFIAYPIAVEPSGEVLLNWVCDLRTATPGTPADENWNREADPSLLLERFADWRWAGLDVPAIVAANRTVYEFPMVDRDPLPRWSFGRVTLAGDAAHAMYPIGSNGATQGIIDARALAYCLATVADPVAALARYEDLRREATTRIVLGNRAQGPDVVLELARQRAPDASVDLATVLSVAERSEIAGAYKRLAGFDPATLAARRSFTVPSR